MHFLANRRSRSAPRLAKIISHEVTRTDKTNTKAREVSSELVVRKVQTVTTMCTHQKKTKSLVFLDSVRLIEQ